MNTMNSSEKDHSVFESCLIKKRKKKKKHALLYKFVCRFPV